MAIPKKGSRKITVNGRQYAWKLNMDDPHEMRLIIALVSDSRKRLVCLFSYWRKLPAPIRDEHGTTWYAQPAGVMTPRVVREVIEHAFTKGWDIDPKGGELFLGNLDDKIDLSQRNGTSSKTT